MPIVVEKLFPGDVVRVELSIEIPGKEKSGDETIVIFLCLLFRRVLFRNISFPSKFGIAAIDGLRRN